MGGDEDAAVEGLRSGACRSVSGLEYAALVRAGCQHMIANKAELNKINVFPIPDGDTGTNMAMAGKGILKGLKRASGERSLAKVAASVAEACVLTAQVIVATRHRALEPACAPRRLARAQQNSTTR